MIEETKNYVEANFPGAKVRYGDTDSNMQNSTLVIERVKKLSSTVGNLVRKPQRSVALFSRSQTTWNLRRSTGHTSSTRKRDTLPNSGIKEG